jgi:hypothetical protein
MNMSNQNPDANLTIRPARADDSKEIWDILQRQPRLERGTDCRKPFPVMGADPKRPDDRCLMPIVTYRARRSGLGGGSPVLPGRTLSRVDDPRYRRYHATRFLRGVGRLSLCPYFERSVKNPGKTADE